MKRTYCKLIVLLTLALTSSSLKAQDLTWRGLELKADYKLITNGQESTGNYDSMTYSGNIFDDGILSRNCLSVSFNDTCIIKTAQITAMNDPAFAIQVEFKANRFGGAIIQAGLGYRYLGMATTGTGQFGIKTGSQKETIFEETVLNLDEWYSASLVHNTVDSVTEVYLNNKLIHTVKQYLNHPANDNEIANNDYSRGYAFSGHLRNLRVYSTNVLTSIKESKHQVGNLDIYPNPSNTNIQIASIAESNITYTITDCYGKELDNNSFRNESIDVQDLSSGMYTLSIFKDNTLYKRGKFVKI
jgi:hypothetical protein